MRIIAGEMRSRKLTAPEGMDTRPTADRVKEALFSSLQGRLYGARVLDLYAGSGALALGGELMDFVLEVASGRQTRNEINGYHDMAIFKQGVTL